jgi:hypothetical protein
MESKRAIEDVTRKRRTFERREYYAKEPFFRVL